MAVSKTINVHIDRQAWSKPGMYYCNKFKRKIIIITYD